MSEELFHREARDSRRMGMNDCDLWRRLIIPDPTSGTRRKPRESLAAFTQTEIPLIRFAADRLLLAKFRRWVNGRLRYLPPLAGVFAGAEIFAASSSAPGSFTSPYTKSKFPATTP